MESKTRSALITALLAFGGAFLFWAMFPPLDLGWLAWLSLVPWLVLACRARPKAVWLWGGLATWTAFFALLHWIRFVTIEGWPLLPIYCAVYLVLLIVLCRWTRRVMPLWITAPALAVALEFLRARLLTGFPFFFLGHTQYRFLPVIQIADALGVAGITALIALVNGCVAEFILRRMEKRRMPAAAAIAAALIVAICLGYGFYRLGTSEFAEGPRVCMVQGNSPQDLKHSSDLDDARKLMRTHVALTREAAGQSVDLVIWPETMVPAPVEVILNHDALRRIVENAKPDDKVTVEYWQWCSGELRGALQAAGCHAFLGGEGWPMMQGGASSNSLFLVRPDGAIIGRYDKMHLVIFGEYVPLAKTFPFLRVFRPAVMGPDLAPGTSARVFDLPTQSGAVKFGGTICYEDSEARLWPQFIRRGARFMVNSTNDGWFRDSSELDQHLAVCVFRAVENRVPIARSANTGLTAIIAPDGRITHRLPRGTADKLIGRLLLDTRRSLFTAWGDWFGLAGLMAAAVTILLRLLRRGPAPEMPTARRSAR